MFNQDNWCETRKIIL